MADADHAFRAGDLVRWDGCPQRCYGEILEISRFGDLTVRMWAQGGVGPVRTVEFTRRIRGGDGRGAYRFTRGRYPLNVRPMRDDERAALLPQPKEQPL